VKIAISSTENGKVDMRFGRCPKFKIVEIEDKKIISEKIIENTAAGLSGGAGIQAAQLIGNEKVEAVITGNLGPNAINTLEQLGIEAYQATGDIKGVVKEFLEGKLKKLQDSTVGLHGGV
jgi:predicted Fe-Mo cluster-binding NifX family protein